MKKRITIFLLLIMAAAINTEAQRRGHQNDRDKNHHQSEERSRSNNRRDHKDHHDKVRHNHKNRQEHNHHYDHRRREVGHVHPRHHIQTPVIVHHHKPRYIYYRDYDVYYDCHRSVYISYSRRRWTASTAMPLAMRHVNMRTTRSYEVDYYKDDFPSYLERGRPAYGREYAGW